MSNTFSHFFKIIFKTLPDPPYDRHREGIAKLPVSIRIGLAAGVAVGEAHQPLCLGRREPPHDAVDAEGADAYAGPAPAGRHQCVGQAILPAFHLGAALAPPDGYRERLSAAYSRKGIILPAAFAFRRIVAHVSALK